MCIYLDSYSILQPSWGSDNHREKHPNIPLVQDIRQLSRLHSPQEDDGHLDLENAPSCGQSSTDLARIG